MLKSSGKFPTPIFCLLGWTRDLRLRSQRHMSKSRSLVQAHNSTRVCWQSRVKSNRVNALRKK